MARLPIGPPTEADFAIRESPIGMVESGDFLVENIYLSVDPSLRKRMSNDAYFGASMEIGDPIFSTTVGRIIESRNDGYKVGDFVFGRFGWQSISLVKGDQLEGLATRLIDPSVPLTKWVGMFGLAGFAAYVGLTDIGQPRPGETVVVSAAAGATGSIAGQLAKAEGARVVGIAGGAEKCAYVHDELGFDVCLDYKTPDLAGQLAKACPAGIDVDWESVGGDVLAAVMPLMNSRGRIVVCGLIAEYDDESPRGGPNLWQVVYKQLRVEGFLSTARAPYRIEQYIERAMSLVKDGKLRQRETIVEGLDNAPSAFIDMLAGRNIGKMLVRVADDPTAVA